MKRNIFIKAIFTVIVLLLAVIAYKMVPPNAAANRVQGVQAPAQARNPASRQSCKLSEPLSRRAVAQNRLPRDSARGTQLTLSKKVDQMTLVGWAATITIAYAKHAAQTS